ncbi:MAG: gamma-glutamyltransferase family protein [Bacteroidia bacterium]
MPSKPKGIIAAGHSETAKAGYEMLQAGGNAFDAVLSAMLVSFIAEASLTSMGGGGFLNTWTAEGESVLFDFFVQTPKIRKPVEEMDVKESYIHFGATSQKQYSGKGTVAVPGCAAGLFHVHKRLGRLPMKEIMAPAIELARKGVLITPYQEYSLDILRDMMLEKPEVAAIYGPNGHTLRTGETMYMPAFADLLELLEREGVRAFYEGEVGQAFAADNEANGGSVSMEDLRAYRVKERMPLSVDYHGYKLYTNPLPSAGGTLICHGLHHLAARPSADSPFGMEHAGRLIETFQAMEAYRKAEMHPPLNDPLGNTTHISVIDAEGNAASLTSTVGGATGELIPNTGIQTNNMLGETDLFPDGLYTWPTNVRVSSMMSPSILAQNDKPKLVIGSGGSSRIRTAIIQVLVNMLDHKMPIQDAVNHPRLHYENGLLSLEPGLLAAEELDQVQRFNPVLWDAANMYFGGTHAAVLRSDGSFAGAADARRSGVVL